MADIGALNPAIAWVHLQIRGGWRNLLLTASAYAVLIGVIILLSLRADPESPKPILAGWVAGLLGLQVGALVLLGCTAIRSAIRKDITCRMIESHRLMPVGAPWAIAGYVLGGGSQALGLFTANLIIGLIICVPAMLSPLDWLVVNGILLVFAFALWCAVSYYALLTKAGLVAVIIVGMVVWSNSGAILNYVPGCVLLLSPLFGQSLFGVLLRSSPVQAEYLYAIIAQGVLAGMCFAAAIRKYRRDDLTSIRPWLGLTLVSWWVLVSSYATHNWDVIRFDWQWGEAFLLPEQSVGSAVIGMLLAILPVAAVAWDEREYRRRKRLGDVELPRRPLSGFLLVLVLSGVLLLIPAAAIPAHRWNRDAIIRTGLVFLFFLMTCSYLLRMVYRRNTHSVLLVCLAVAALWLGPWIVEGMRMSLHQEPSDLGLIPACSSIGALTYVCSGSEVSTTPGLIVQGAVMLLLAVLYHATRGPRLEGRPVQPARL